jgi:signal transduction histidine kinase
LRPDAVLDALSTPTAILNEKGIIIEANTAWRELALCPDHLQLIGTVGDSYLRLCECAIGEMSGAAIVKKGLGRVLSGHLTVFERTCRAVRQSAYQYLRVRVKSVDTSDPLRLMVSLKDVTELAEAQQVAHDLSQRVLDAEMNERQRFATELHDSVGQSVVSLNLSLLRLRMLIDQNDEISSVLTDMGTAIDEVQTQIRTVSYLLQPPWPEETGGLEICSSQFVQGFARRAGLKAHIRMPRQPCPIDSDRQMALFRILQEALVNVHRHALATTVAVELVDNGAEIVLRVKDDGQGIRHANGTDFAPGAGMLGMRARLKEFGGTLKIDSGPAGTILTASLPVDAENVLNIPKRQRGAVATSKSAGSPVWLGHRTIAGPRHSSNQRY